MTSIQVIVIVAILAGAACSLVGVFLVLRRTAMLADAISHSILPGLVAAYAFAQGPNLLYGFIGAAAAGLLTVWLVEALTKARLVKQDSAIGIVFPAMFALGVVIIAKYFANAHLDTDAVLYGSIEFAPFDFLRIQGKSYGPIAFWTLGALFLINLLGIMAVFKELKVSTFDPGFALVAGIAPGVIFYGLMTLVAVTTVGSFSAVGAILSVGLIITPAATARLLTDRLMPMIAIALGVGIGGSLIGVSLALRFDVSISGLIATVLGVLFLLAVLFSPSQGVVTKALSRRRLRRSFASYVLLMHLETHEGDADSEIECRRSHLSEEFGWSESWVAQVVEEAEHNQWIEARGEQLSLTPAGRTAVSEFSASF